MELKRTVNRRRLVFRADGDRIKGYGHVIRSLSMATMLKKKYSCVFVIQKPDSFLKEQIKNNCDQLVELPASKNCNKELTVLTRKIIHASDIVVLDGYNFNTAYQSIIKKACFKVVCIDDVYNTHFVADAVINHSEEIKIENYSKESYTDLYLGTPYAILRRSFLKSKSFKDSDSFSKNRVFINLGGTDPDNYTEKALKACLKNENIKFIDIVIGGFYRYTNELKKMILANKTTKINLHSNLSEQKICSLMKKSSAAICSASTISYEYSSVGGILFVYQTATNQKNIYSFLIKSKIAFPVKDFRKKLSELRETKAREDYYLNRFNYFSGKSKKNIVSIFEKLEADRGVTVRVAKKKDVLTYYRWVNDASVRENSVNKSLVLLEGHKTWFFSKLKSKNAVLFIIEKNTKPIGQVRFDRSKKLCEVDYSVEKTFRGKGLGEIILKKAISKYLSRFPSDKIIAKVKQSNAPSNRVFVKLGFHKLKSEVKDSIRYNNYVYARGN